MAEISVIIPVYNAEKYIAGCLDALCAQTFGDIEVLCVDDGSTDGSGSILAEYAGKDPRIRVFPQANSGPAAARNLGLKTPADAMSCFATRTTVIGRTVANGCCVQ